MTYSIVEFKSHEMVFKQGEEGDLMYLVQEGEVEVLHEIGGVQKQMAILERGDFFGEMAVLEQEPRSHSVRSLKLTKLVTIDRAGFKSMLTRNADISVRMIRKLSKRLLSAEDMLLRAYAGTASVADASPDLVAGRARLLYVAENLELPLPMQPEIKVGRIDPINHVHPDVDLTKIDKQLTTSRRHARLLRRSDGFFIQEEQATNGTFVNGQRISAERPLEIRAGDDIMFGAVHMRFLVD